MRHLRTKWLKRALIPLGVSIVTISLSAAISPWQQKKILVVEELETGAQYAKIPVEAGD